MKLFVGASHLPLQQGKEFERSVADLFGCAASSSLHGSTFFFSIQPLSPLLRC